MKVINYPTLLILSGLIICLWIAGMFFPRLKLLRIASIISLIIVLSLYEVLGSPDSLMWDYLDYLMYPAILIAVLTLFFLNYVIGCNISPHEAQWPTIAIASMFIYCTLVLFVAIKLVKYTWKKYSRKATTPPV
jgi:hypothetical protein